MEKFILTSILLSIFASNGVFGGIGSILPILLPTASTSSPPVVDTCAKTEPSVPNSQPYCSAAISDFGNGNLVPGPSARDPSLLPAWINIPLAIKGQQLVNDNLFGIFLGNLYGITASLQYSSLAELLLFTGANTDGVPQRRYVATMAQIQLWARDVFNSEANTDNVIRSITNVRTLHSSAGNAARRALKANGTYGNEAKYGSIPIRDYLWDAVRKDMDLYMPEEFKNFTPSYTNSLNASIPMNQFEFAIVQWSTIGLMMLNPEKVLLYTMTDEKLTAINHLWAVLGYALGMDDKYNLCLQPNIVAQKQFFRDFFDNYIRPAVYSPSRMAKVLIEVVGTAFVGQATVTLFDNRTTEFALEVFFKRFMLDFLGFPATPNLDKVSSSETKAFLVFYDTIFIPSSRLVTFTGAQNVAINGLVAAMGRVYFPGNYTTDENISKTVYHPDPSTAYSAI